MNKAIELIEKQQSGKDNTPAFVIGLHLIDMMKQDGRIEAILEEDLKNPEMSLENCAKKLQAEADNIHKQTKRNPVCLTPLQAEKIIRKFYGLPDPEDIPQLAPAPEPSGIIDLEDLL